MSKWVDEGENRTADILFGSQAVDASLYMGLYTNTSEAVEASGLSTIQEPSGNGYTRKTLSRGSWTVSGANASYAEQTFTAAGGDWGNCYGYFIATSTDSSGKLLCVEQFSDGPYSVDDTESVKVTSIIRVS